jgi:RNA polymerase sigma-70 factor (ECF subfamily)
MTPLAVRLEVQIAPSDEQLIRQILAGDRDAYAKLVRRYERHAHAAAWMILRDHHAAQDVTQDAFVKAYRQLGELRTPPTFGIWLLTIVRRTAIDAVRGRQRLTFVPQVPDSPTPTSPAEADAAAILAAATKLPDHEQQVLLLRYFDNLSVADIAVRLGRPVGTVTKQLSRALSRLRGLLEETP